MQRYFFALTVLAVGSTCAHAQIALVRATSCGPVVFPTSTCSISSTGAGNLIVVGIQLRGAGASTIIATVTDNVNNSYAEATGALAIDSASGSVADIWYAKNGQPGATTVTIAPSGIAAGGSAVVWEFSGANTTAPLDAVAEVNSQAGNTTPRGAPATTAYSNEVVVSVAAVAGSITGIFAGNSFTSDSTTNNEGWAHLIAASTGTYAAQWNQSSPGTFASSTASFRAANSSSTFSACDLNQDGTVNVIDVQLATNMNLGLRACSANVTGSNVCSNLVIQQIKSAALPPNVCTTANSHSVLLTWAASTTGGVNYNVYRSSSLGGPYAKLTAITSIAGLSYIDSTVSAGQTYYYEITAVNSSGESAPTTPTSAAVPFP